MSVNGVTSNQKQKLKHKQERITDPPSRVILPPLPCHLVYQKPHHTQPQPHPAITSQTITHQLCLHSLQILPLPDLSHLIPCINHRLLHVYVNLFFLVEWWCFGTFAVHISTYFSSRSSLAIEVLRSRAGQVGDIIPWNQVMFVREDMISPHHPAESQWLVLIVVSMAAVEQGESKRRSRNWRHPSLWIQCVLSLG